MVKIMIVEDNEFNMDALTRLLRRKGFDVVCAESGELAVEQAPAETPDVILMDIGLPGIDGYETTRQIKSDTKTATIPIIALTAHAYDSGKFKAEEAGCVSFDTKPVELDRLLRKIDGVLAGSTGWIE